jgi:hypothetical protein
VKFFYRKAGFMTAMLLSCVLTGCTQIKDIVGRYESEPKQTVKETFETEYTVLNDDDEILALLLDTMKNNKNSCSFNVETQDLINTKRWMTKLAGISNISVEYSKAAQGYNVYLSLEYWDNYPIVEAYEKNDRTGLTAKQVTLLNRYEQILDECVRTDMSAYEKELAVHDYLVEHVEYDSTQAAEDTHTAYGAVVLGRAVCDGYMESFQTLMDLLGIQSICVVGEGNGEPHGWNMVCLDGAWYHVDVTWDDPVGGTGMTSHKYFNVADSEMGMEHIWDRTVYPAAAGIRYSYYLCGDITQVYSQEEFNSFMSACLKQHMDQIEVVVHGSMNFEEALKSAGMSFNYSYNIIDRGSFKVYEMSITY